MEDLRRILACRMAKDGEPYVFNSMPNYGCRQDLISAAEVFLAHTKLTDQYVLHLTMGNIRTEEKRIARAWELLRAECGRLSGGLTAGRQPATDPIANRQN